MTHNGIGSHQSARMKNDEWLTPPALIKALGEFDLDPCAPTTRPWPTARAHYDVLDDGLSLPWIGRVWCNPPYGQESAAWLARLAEHGTGTALIFARTETALWFDHVWRRAHAILFLRGRLHFHYVDGRRAEANSGAPSALIAYGANDAAMLRASGLEGALIDKAGIS
ncbi:MAG: DNA N-6-adenine-methyltransferase [Caldimonas sp.]